MNFTIYLGFYLVLIAMIIVRLPNKYIDTSSCKRNWLIIFTILIGATLIIGQNELSMYLVGLLFLGIFINYTFPFLLNVLTSFNRKSDP